MTMAFSKRVKAKWDRLSKAGKSAVAVPLFFVFGVLLWVFGREVGKVLYSVFGG